jgi:hypothetical protein
MAELQKFSGLRKRNIAALCVMLRRMVSIGSQPVRHTTKARGRTFLTATRACSFLGVFVMAAAMVFGCGRGRVPSGPPRSPTVPAGGVLTVRGLPFAGATVVFHHEEGRASAIGTTDSEGRFALSTYQHDDGAPAGNYLVTVAANNTTEVEPGVLAPLSADRSRSVIPAAYADPQTSSLTFEIPPAGNTEIRINLK